MASHTWCFGRLIVGPGREAAAAGSSAARETSGSSATGRVLTLAAGAPGRSTRTIPDANETFRSELTVKSHDAIEQGWTGSIRPRHGVAPRVRVARKMWFKQFNPFRLIPNGFVLAGDAIPIGRDTAELPAVKSFIDQYPGMSEISSGVHISAEVAS